jgi:hypothetical protein
MAEDFKSQNFATENIASGTRSGSKADYLAMVNACLIGSGATLDTSRLGFSAMNKVDNTIYLEGINLCAHRLQTSIFAMMGFGSLLKLSGIVSCSMWRAALETSAPLDLFVLF